MTHYIGIKDGKNIIFEEYTTYEKAYNEYMQRYALYPSGHMWMTER